jgi:hypothetical protein
MVTVACHDPSIEGVLSNGPHPSQIDARFLHIFVERGNE